MRRLLLAAALAALTACDGKPKEPPAKPSVPTAPAPAPTPVELPATYTRPAPERLVAIGDLHGDLRAVKAAFELAGATDASGTWTGGKLVVVQTGDVLDRGDDDKAILDWLERVQAEAKAAGGELILLYGNHELMNVQGDFRYVTPGALRAFGGGGPVASADVPSEQLGRKLAFAPGGTYAKKLAATHLLFVRVGDSVFLHGGVQPKYVKRLASLADGVTTWLQGANKSAEAAVMAEDSPVWSRAYSDKPDASDCKDLEQALGGLGAARMVMGHTVQSGGIQSACDGKAWLIDVGMSSFYHGPIEVLEIRGDQIKPLHK